MFHRAWNWNQTSASIWLEPCEDIYNIANRWKKKEYKDILDFGCGLGRHAIFFAQKDFQISAFDLSEEDIN